MEVHICGEKADNRIADAVEMSGRIAVGVDFAAEDDARVTRRIGRKLLMSICMMSEESESAGESYVEQE